ncbi:hypothetical protein [Acidisphaera sp. L21]|uniref:hypothetical protein n=1 Tax=Acidisphaera sp. L21 TaxID=1641851 RepID=UPI00131CDB3D|nr:hypothetical protein [Acidisphaera sp. L21]
MLIVPYKLLSAICPTAEDDTVTIPVDFLKQLLRLALQNATLDEETYLRRNPDVAAAIRTGSIGSGRDHFAQTGYFEGRGGTGFDVAESWYVRSNPDVARAIVMREWESGEMHYNERGLLEWRAPNNAAAQDLMAWERLLDPGSPSHTDDEAELPL